MKSMVVYYTWSGRTRAMAELIAAQTGAELLEIQPEIPYTSDYHAVVEQVKKEIREAAPCPIRAAACDPAQYDVFYLGTPIWWGTLATPLATFLREKNLAGKIVMPFSTHGGGGKGHADRDIQKLCAGADVRRMYTAYEGGGSKAADEIAAWIGENLGEREGRR